MALPARGAKAGIKADVQAAKDAGAGYTASTATSGWSHDFLNKKPWHPSNFRNQLKKYEAEQETITRAKREEVAKAEFDAEQRYLDTLSMLPSKDADKYRQQQSVSWMYMKPPGLVAWEEEYEKKQKQEHQAGGNIEKGQGAVQDDRGTAVLTPADVTFTAGADGKKATISRSGHARSQGTGTEWSLNVKKRERSPPRGGFSWQDGNQQFLAPDESPDEPPLSPPRSSKRSKSSKKEKKKDKRRHKDVDWPGHDLKEALQTLVEQGIDLDKLPELLGQSLAEKHKKPSKKSKKEPGNRRDRDSSGSRLGGSPSVHRKTGLQECDDDADVPRTKITRSRSNPDR